jgi:hypothetical protein
MKDLYVISKGDPYQLVDDVEQIEGGYNLTGLDNSLLLDLDEPGGKKRVEQRCHQRFHLNDDAFALIRSIPARPLNIQDKSMGGIACAVFKARPARLGKIDNIGMGGLMFQHIAGKSQLNRTFVLEILSADCRFYLAKMPFEIKADVGLPDDIPGSSIEMRQVRLQFQTLGAGQQAKLKEFLLNHGTEMGGIGAKD